MRYESELFPFIIKVEKEAWLGFARTQPVNSLHCVSLFILFYQSKRSADKTGEVSLIRIKPLRRQGKNGSQSAAKSENVENLIYDHRVEKLSMVVLGLRTGLGLWSLWSVEWYMVVLVYGLGKEHRLTLSRLSVHRLLSGCTPSPSSDISTIFHLVHRARLLHKYSRILPLTKKLPKLHSHCVSDVFTTFSH